MPADRRPEVRATHPGIDTRSRLARVADAQPARFYDPARGRAEPAAVTAARARHRQIDAEIAEQQRAAEQAVAQSVALHEESQPDPGPDPEWYRELDAEAADEKPLPAAPPLPRFVAAVADPDPVPLMGWDEVAHFRAADDPAPADAPGPGPAADQAPAAAPDPVPDPDPPAPARCGRCGYLTTAAGHKVACGA